MILKPLQGAVLNLEYSQCGVCELCVYDLSSKVSRLVGSAPSAHTCAPQGDFTTRRQSPWNVERNVAAIGRLRDQALTSLYVVRQREHHHVASSTRHLGAAVVVAVGGQLGGTTARGAAGGRCSCCLA